MGLSGARAWGGKLDVDEEFPDMYSISTYNQRHNLHLGRSVALRECLMIICSAKLHTLIPMKQQIFESGQKMGKAFL